MFEIGQVASEVRHSERVDTAQATRMEYIIHFCVVAKCPIVGRGASKWNGIDKLGIWRWCYCWRGVGNPWLGWLGWLGLLGLLGLLGWRGLSWNSDGNSLLTHQAKCVRIPDIVKVSTQNQGDG